MTNHAQVRIRQRAVPYLVVDWLLDYGASHHDHHGAEIRYFDRQSRRKLEQTAGKRVIAHLSKFLDCYLVCTTDGIILTAGHRYKRVYSN